MLAYFSPFKGFITQIGSAVPARVGQTNPYLGRCWLLYKFWMLRILGLSAAGFLIQEQRKKGHFVNLQHSIQECVEDLDLTLSFRPHRMFSRFVRAAIIGGFLSYLKFLGNETIRIVWLHISFRFLSGGKSHLCAPCLRVGNDAKKMRDAV